MSHKIKTPTKEIGASASSFNDLPHDVLKVGYLRKLKKMKRKFFVLRQSNGDSPSRLEYYPSEKKWRSGCDPKRTIVLKSCFNISRKLHPKHKCVICLYAQDECFSIIMENDDELDEWLSIMLELQLNEVEVDEESKEKFVYEHVWQVIVDDRELEFSKDVSGLYCLGLTAKSLSLIRMNSTPNNLKVLEFPLMSIRRCGHSGKHFFIELGRSAVTGAGGMWMETEGTIVAQNMHETILSAMKSSRNKGELGPHSRPRSASTSENSKPIATRRPVGVVLPQPLPPFGSTLSNSRERCDTMPCRARAISESIHDSSYSGMAYYPDSTRPHSVYAWPLNSPTMSNLSFSPSSLSTSISSNMIMMNDDMEENISPYHLSHCLHTQTSDSSFLPEPPVQEMPDEYLLMSPTDDNKNIIPQKTDYLNMNPASSLHSVSPMEERNISEPLECSSARSNPVDYMDMKSPSSHNFRGMMPLNSEVAFAKRSSSSSFTDHSVSEKMPIKEGYVAMAPCGASDDLPVPMQDGYLSMSPISSSLPKHVDDNSFSFSDCHASNSTLDSDPSEFKLDKVQSLVKQENDDEQDFIKPVRAYSIGSRSQIYESRARAYSVGSESAKANFKVPVDECAGDSVNINYSSKSNSAPILRDFPLGMKLEQEVNKNQENDLMEIDFRKSSEQVKQASEQENAAKKSFSKKGQRTTSRSSCTSSALLSLDERGEKIVFESKGKPPVVSSDNFRNESISSKAENNQYALKRQGEFSSGKNDDYFEMSSVSESSVKALTEEKVSYNSGNTTKYPFNKTEEPNKSNKFSSNTFGGLDNESFPMTWKLDPNVNIPTISTESNILSTPNSCTSTQSELEKAEDTRIQSTEGDKNQRDYFYPMNIPVSLNNSILKSPSSVNVPKAQINNLCSNNQISLLSPKSSNVERVSVPGEYINLVLSKSRSGASSPQQALKTSDSQTRATCATSTLPVAPVYEPNYMNIKLGKPYTPLPNPSLVSSSPSTATLIDSLKMNNTAVSSSSNNTPILSVVELNFQRSPSNDCNPPVSVKTGIASARPYCPQSLPTIRKQMSAPAVPPSLQPEMVSPGRKSSCPVTASASMMKSFITSPSTSCKIVNLPPASGSVGTSKASSRSPDHNSVSMTDTTRTSPKTLSTAPVNTELGSLIEMQYENVSLPSTSSAFNSRPSSVSSEKELIYASLDLAPAGGNEVPQSPRAPKLLHQQMFDESEPLTYAEIDFTKSEGLRHTSGALREGRL